MMTKQSLFSTLSAMCVSICLMFSFIAYSLFSNDVKQQMQAPPPSYKIPERIINTKKPTIVAVGNSLIRFGFPFDEDLENIAKQQGLSIRFARITHSSVKLNEIKALLSQILIYHPSYVFLQADPLIADTSNETILPKISTALHFVLLNILWPKHLSPHSETDADIKLNRIALLKDLKKLNLKFTVHPVLPEEFLDFFQKAKKQHIHIIFLIIHRSIEQLKLMGENEVTQEKAIHNLATTYSIPLWEFKSLPLKFYIDGRHLNNKGRMFFSQWFINKIKDEIFKNA